MSTQASQWIVFMGGALLLHPRATAEPSCSGATHYRVVELVGAANLATEAAAINSKGEVAGFSEDDILVSYALRWNSAGSLEMLSPNRSAQALTIADDGTVAGRITTSQGSRGALWNPNGEMRWLEPLRGHEDSAASAVNSLGTAVGTSANTNGETFAVAWHGARAASALSAAHATSSAAADINDDGAIVGHAEYEVAPLQRAMLWRVRGATTLPGLGAGFDRAEAISSTGIVAGTSVDPSTDEPHAVVWRAGRIEDLGAKLGERASAAHGVNRCGAVVGEVVADPIRGRTSAVVWFGGTATELDKMVSDGEGWTFVTARAINDAGEIVGYGYLQGRVEATAYLLKPERAR
jgi:uncharacterized membrane protein